MSLINSLWRIMAFGCARFVAVLKIEKKDTFKNEYKDEFFQPEMVVFFYRFLCASLETPFLTFFRNLWNEKLDPRSMNNFNHFHWTNSQQQLNAIYRHIRQKLYCNILYTKKGSCMHSVTIQKTMHDDRRRTFCLFLLRAFLHSSVYSKKSMLTTILMYI